MIVWVSAHKLIVGLILMVLAWMGLRWDRNGHAASFWMLVLALMTVAGAVFAFSFVIDKLL